VDTMKTAGVAELKAKLSEHLALVKGGEEVLITEHGEPIARIIPIAPAETDEEKRLHRLAAKGLVRLPRKRDPEALRRLLESLPVAKVPAGTIARLMDEERGDR
jgi:prevent-host-death family protein